MKTYLKIRQVQDIDNWDICGSSMVYSPREAARDTFGAPDYDTRGNQVMYLFRRFGYPIHGWDDHKSIMDFFLTTPDPDIILWCKPYGIPDMSFGFGISLALSKAAEAAEFAWRCTTPRTEEWKSTPFYQRIDRAIRSAMHELLRPVYIRDTDYNLLGRVKEDAPAFRKAAEHSPQAGYGIWRYDPIKGKMRP